MLREILSSRLKYNQWNIDKSDIFTEFPSQTGIIREYGHTNDGNATYSMYCIAKTAISNWTVDTEILKKCNTWKTKH